MGTTPSKAARTAASTTTRKYPTRPPPPPSHHNTQPIPTTSSSNSTPSTFPGPTVHPSPSASPTKSPAITSDASDPDFAASLRSLGPVNPNSTLSNSSAFHPGERGGGMFPDPAMNPAVQVLAARERLAGEAEREFARVRGYVDEEVRGVVGEGTNGRRFLDVMAIRQVLVMRDEKGMREGEIERKMGLAGGVVGRLGGRGVVGEVEMGKGG